MNNALPIALLLLLLLLLLLSLLFIAGLCFLERPS
jgi:hypothetical protein